MALKLIRETSIPDVIKKKLLVNPELFEMIQEFDESDMNMASIDMDDAEQKEKLKDQTRRYCKQYFGDRVKTIVRDGKIYLMKI